MKKILITGPGRSGTTFLMKLFTLLEYDTGFTKENYQNYVYKNCNAGMEKGYPNPHYISKNPLFMSNIETVIEKMKIKQVIIPIRNLEASAKSRASRAKENGGLWNAENEQEQLTFYKNILSNYLEYMVKYDIPTLFLDFDQMVNNKYYLFVKIKHILDEREITFEKFSEAYLEASESSR